MNITAVANAKINLTLDITGLRADGYHSIDTVMQSVGLSDTVSVSCDGSKRLTVLCDHIFAPGGTTNIAYKAATAFFEYTGESNPGICIKIDKTIPVSAGLAGGSADGAAVICALDKMLGTSLTTEQLCEIGVKIGADLPFCITGGTARATGIGEQLYPLKAMPDCFIVIAKPNIGISTKKAYQAIDGAKNPFHPDTEAMVDAVENGQLDRIAALLGNTFENALALSKVAGIKKIMKKNNTLGCAMSGSGSAVFGIFDQKSVAEKCRNALTLSHISAFVCTPCSNGVVI